MKVKSIRTKLVLLLSITALIAILLSSITTLTSTIYASKQHDVRELSQLAIVIGHTLEASVEFDDEDSAVAILNTLSFNENIKAAFFFTKENYVFSKYIKEGIESQSILTLLTSQQANHKAKQEYDYIDFDNILVNRKIVTDGTYIGSFVLITDTSILKNRIINELIMQLLASLIALFIILVLAFKVQKSFTSPIFKLKKAMEQISASKTYDIKINDNSQDEFKVLFDGFNLMISKIKEQKQEVDLVHKQVRDSIDYAAIIQKSLIPDSGKLKSQFVDHFVIWQPKDVVSGDIYFFEQLRAGDESLLMLIDCTGHGVPGGFVTMLVKAIEKQIIAEINYSDEEVSPAKILSTFNSTIKDMLQQYSKTSMSNVGFDGGILYYNKTKQLLKFSGAETPLFIVKNKALELIKGSRHSVGYKSCKTDYEYQEHTIAIQKDMAIYLSTDGYFDQSGGDKGFGFGKKRFKELLCSFDEQSMSTQETIFINELAEYQGNLDRNDDITVAGIKF
ncbi:SpoIIE family protein phosphatase [Thalassotalea sp. PLHSN55]|uniref:SpoIIE family protein phosphatase n=1 Tax=Thalassotalea sp. PLHSN55 TaxID=3435888 RepID=UPI003F833665